MESSIRDTQPEDAPAIRQFVHRLADFDALEWRQTEDLWRGDWEVYSAFFEGKKPECFSRVAEAERGEILGSTLVTMRPEPLSLRPSAHLEVLVLDEGAQGQGLGRRMLEDAHRESAARGAETITLHVFSKNARARRLYEKQLSCPYYFYHPIFLTGLLRTFRVRS